MKTTAFFERVRTDVVRPIEKMSSRRSRYLATALQEHRGFSLVMFMDRKENNVGAGIEVIRALETSFHQNTERLKYIDYIKVKRLRSDGGRI